MVDVEFELIIIKSLFSNELVRRKVVPLLDEKWFNNDINASKIVEKIIEFNTRYESMPTVTDMRRMINDSDELAVFDKAVAIPDEEVSSQYLIGEIEKFVKEKKLWAVASNIIQYCKTPDSAKQNCSFSEMVTDAEAYTFDDSIGFSYMDEPERIYQEIIKNEKVVGTGLKALDDLLKGGLHEKSLTLLLSPTNVGKTLIMCALAKNMLQAGFNVLYITFEDSENKIGQRITQNLFDLSRDELKAMSLQDYQKCWNKYKNVIKANLYIKEFPEMATNALNLHAFIKELKERKDFIPDIVFVDYIGCMIPNGRDNPNMNSNTRLLTIASQVRSISMVESFPIVSGAQVNRGGYDSANIGLNDAADSFGQTMKADAILAITQSKELLDNGYYDVEIAKTRFGNNKGEHKTIRVSIDKQRIMDIDGYTSSANTSTMSDIILTDTEHSMQNAANIII